MNAVKSVEQKIRIKPIDSNNHAKIYAIITYRKI